MRVHRTRSIATAVLIGAAACRRDKGVDQQQTVGGDGISSGAATPSRNTQASAVKTWPVDADPCAWVTAAEVAKIIGPLDGAPWRANHADGAERDPKGFACGYTLAAPNGGNASDDRIAMEVTSVDVTTAESGFAMMRDRFSTGHAGDPFKTAVEAVGLNKKTRTGWDYTGGLPNSFIARIGALAITFGIYTSRVSEDSIARLAMLVRQRVPDLPKESKIAEEHADGSMYDDGCVLITQAEAEAVLGKLTMAPYRSDHDTPDADPGGEGCSYYLGNHRVFTIHPSWDQGKTLFKMAAGFNQGVSNVLGATGESADTLEGNWDQVAAGVGGNLYFLKGDAMLEVVYATAAVDKAKALQLASIALRRLARAKK